MFIEYLDNKIQGLKEEEIQLQNLDRNDEANFTKVKINICEICKTLYNVSKKEPNGQNEAEFYWQKVEKLSAEWKASLNRAKEHGDIEKAIIEEIKLEVLNEVGENYNHDRSRCN